MTRIRTKTGVRGHYNNLKQKLTTSALIMKDGCKLMFGLISFITFILLLINGFVTLTNGYLMLELKTIVIQTNLSFTQMERLEL